MHPLRTVYTREELLRIAALANGVEVSSDIIDKFNVIEVSESTAIVKRRETDLAAPGAPGDNSTSIIGSGLASNNTSVKPNSSGGANGTGNGGSGGSSSANNGGLGHSNAGPTLTHHARNNSDGRRGGNNGRDDAGGNSNNNTNNRRTGEDRRTGGYDRFAPPEGRFSRGNRNQETFEFGVEYELQQSAMQKKRVTETMEREDRRGEQLKQALEKFKQADTEPESKDAVNKEVDEIERLLAGITMSDDTQPKTVVRSRFFSAQAPAAAAAPTAPAQVQPPVQAQTQSQSQAQLQQQQLSAPATAAAAPPATSNASPVSSSSHAKVLMTPSNSGTPGYAASPWGNVKNDPNLWATAPSMASALKQSLQQQQQPGATTSPSSPAQTKPATPPQLKSPSQPPQQPPPPTPPVTTSTPPAMGGNAGVSPLPTMTAQGGAATTLMNFSTASTAAGVAGPAPSSASTGGASTSIAAMGIKASVLGLSSQQSHPTSATPPAGANPPTPSRAWTAAELEQLLKSGKAVPTAAPPPPPSSSHLAAVPPQPTPAKVFAAADLENMLMQQARQGAASTRNSTQVQPTMPQPMQQPQAQPQPQPQPPTPPQQPMPPQPAPPQFMTSVKTPTMVPQHTANTMGSFVGGTVPRSPPQQFSTGMKVPLSPPMLPHQPQPQQPQQPWMAVPQPQQVPQQQSLPQHPSGLHITTPQQPQHVSKMPLPNMSMPIMMNAQGQYFAAPPQSFFLPGQPVMFRRPDGTVFMQPAPQPQPPQQPQFNPFGTNAQYLFQQQQQQQQQQQRR
jgi:hypothetical protein